MKDEVQGRIAREISNIVDKVIDDLLPVRVEEIIAERLARNPSAPLTRIGFSWALSVALRRHWSNIDARTASRWLMEYIGVPFGTHGYDWTFVAAQEVAAEYVNEHGECAA